MIERKVRIDKNCSYSLGEIVRFKFIPSVTTIPLASRLVQSGLLKGEKKTRGLRGVQYRVLGADIISYLNPDHGKSKKG